MPVQPISPQPRDAASPGAENTDYYRRALHELIDMGVSMARLFHDQAVAQAEAAAPDTGAQTAPTPAPGLAAAFDRVSRAVRRTVLLARHLDAPLPAHSGTDPAKRREAARRRIIRAVEDRIDREARGEREAERMHAELLERLDSPDLDDDIEGRPVTDIIIEIFNDLGFDAPGASPWKRRTPADVAVLSARAAKPSPARTPPAPGASAPSAQPEAERFFRLVAAPD